MEKIITSFLLKLGKRQERPQTLPLFNTVLEVLAIAHREWNMMSKIAKVLKMSLFIEEIPENSWKASVKITESKIIQWDYGIQI